MNIDKDHWEKKVEEIERELEIRYKKTLKGRLTTLKEEFINLGNVLAIEIKKLFRMIGM